MLQSHVSIRAEDIPLGQYALPVSHLTSKKKP